MKNEELLEEFQNPVSRDDDEAQLEDEDVIDLDDELADEGDLDIEPDDERDY